MFSVLSYLSSSNAVASAQKFLGIEALDESSDPCPSPLDELDNSNNFVSNDNEVICNGNNPESIIKSKYKINNLFFYYLFAVGSNCGNEVFYISFLPFCFWSVDAYVGRQLCVHWCIFMFIGQATKDILKIPRPFSPPVVHLEEKYFLEYGMPSTHAMVAAGFPYALYLLTAERYLYSRWMFIFLGSIWCLVICGSRIYLGMHSFLDVIVGILYSIFIISVSHYIFLNSLEFILLKTDVGIAFILSIPFLLLIYPQTPYWKNTKGDTAIILGVTAGLMMSYRILDYWRIIIETVGEDLILPYQIGGFNFYGFMVGTLRSFVGVSVLVAGRFFCKAIAEYLVLKVLNVQKSECETAKVEIPRKFITYFLLAGIGFIFVPLLLKFLNLHRYSYFAEFSFKNF